MDHSTRDPAYAAVRDFIVSNGGSPRFAEPSTGCRFVGPVVPRAPVIEDSLRLVKRRAQGRRELQFVTCQDEDGVLWNWTCRVDADAGGNWHVTSAGGGGSVSAPTTDLWRTWRPATGPTSTPVVS